MDELSNPDPRPRASLRGKGREILLGEHSETPPSPDREAAQPVPLPEEQGHVDPAALKLSPDETEALLDFSPDSPAYAAEASFPSDTAPVPTKAASTPFEAPEVTPDDVLLDWMKGEPAGEEVLAASGPDLYTPAGPDAETAVYPEMPDWSAEARPEAGVDALPLAEREPQPAFPWPEPAYPPLPETEPATSQTAEQWSEMLPVEMQDQVPNAVPAVPASQPVVESGAGGSLVAESQAEPLLTDPFLTNNKEFKRPTARALFDETAHADAALLTLLVDDDHILKLSQQIEALQEDLAQHVYGDRKTADAYQKELLQASSLLLSSRENYDDARAIVYRIRSDMNRQRKAEADIRRYRPLLLNYYIGWGIALMVLFLLKALFTGVTDAVGAGVASAMYYPILVGTGGALVSGYLTLERHTTRLRDFDPLHISWYLFNPLLGGVMGLLMFLLASIANDDLLRGTANDAENAITYLLCVVAGMNQNSVLHQLNDLLKRFGKGSSS